MSFSYVAGHYQLFKDPTVLKHAGRDYYRYRVSPLSRAKFYRYRFKRLQWTLMNGFVLMPWMAFNPREPDYCTYPDPQKAINPDRDTDPPETLIKSRRFNCRNKYSGREKYPYNSREKYGIARWCFATMYW
jgi:hypothetical protein